MLLHQRHMKILETLQKQGQVRTMELSREMGVSTETIRKDLDALAAQGKLKKVHGGGLPLLGAAAVPAGEGAYVRFEQREEWHSASKQSIARFAVSMVPEGGVIGLDAGTSTYAMMDALRQYCQRLTIVTNSLKIAVSMSGQPGFTVVMSGGVVMPDEHACVSDFASLVWQRVRVDVLFLTVSGIEASMGLSDQRMEEVRIQQEMIRAAKRVVVLADSSKFGKSSFVHMAPLDVVDVFVTDSHIDPEQKRILEDKGCHIMIAEEHLHERV